MKKWREFERLIAHLLIDDYEENNSYTIIPNIRMKGLISQRKRQIDVLIEFRYDSDLSRRIIIDAKNKKRLTDIKEVETFEGLMRDVGAQKGFLVCSNGYTKAALKRAQEHISIRLVTPEEIENINLSTWDRCLYSDCTEGLILWNGTPGIFFDDKVAVQYLGKCDECGRFHIWCWSCGNRKVLGKEDEWQCACQGPWFWLTSIEPEEDSNGAQYDCAYLFLVLSNDCKIMDRRPL
jgi:hypothetical protein